jgi:hypothetical protein
MIPPFLFLFGYRVNTAKLASFLDLLATPQVAAVGFIQESLP